MKSSEDWNDISIKRKLLLVASVVRTLAAGRNPTVRRHLQILRVHLG